MGYVSEEDVRVGRVWSSRVVRVRVGRGRGGGEVLRGVESDRMDGEGSESWGDFDIGDGEEVDQTVSLRMCTTSVKRKRR